MKTAVLFSSNMTKTEIADKREHTFNIISASENIDVLNSLASDDIDTRIVDLQDEHEFPLNISTNENINKVDNANKEYLINNDNGVKITDSQHCCATPDTGIRPP